MKSELSVRRFFSEKIPWKGKGKSDLDSMSIGSAIPKGISANTTDEQWRNQAEFNEDMKFLMNGLEGKFDELCNQVTSIYSILEGLNKDKASVSASDASFSYLKADLPILSPVTKGFSVKEAAANWPDKGKELTHEDLQLLTNNFSPENCFGRTQFGVLYKGIIPEGWKGMRSGEATIKIWKNEQFVSSNVLGKANPKEVRFRMEQEIKFLQQSDIAMNPYTAKVMGYCYEDNNLGVVYDLKPLQTLRKYFDNEKFGWRERVLVAMKLASLLKFFHTKTPQYIVRNLSAFHVMLDQDLNPILIDYAMIYGGSYEKYYKEDIAGSWGYIDNNETLLGYNTQRNDMYAYGIILLELIGRYTFNQYRRYGLDIHIFVWKCYMNAKEKYEKHGHGHDGEFCYSFAHQCLRNDPHYDAHDGNKITLLAFKCCRLMGRPDEFMMGDVMEELKELKVWFKSYPELLVED